MKTLHICTLLIFFSLGFAQKKSGVAVYKVTPIQENHDKKDAFSMLKNQADNALGFISYNLYFSPTASLYSLDEKMKTDASDRQQELALIMAGREKYYTQKNKDSLLYQTIFNGDLFLITQSSKNTLWNITTEKKIINGFECVKAIGHHTPSHYKTGYEVVAWFTPKLPLPYGPRGFSGLPGLILELEEKAYGNIYYCTQINFDESVTFEKPDKGIKMSHLKFQEYAKEKASEFFKLIEN